MIDFKILDQNIGTRIQRDLDNSAALEGVHPRDYPHDIYLNGDQYYEWMNEMIDTYASRNPDNQSRDSQFGFLKLHLSEHKFVVCKSLN